MELIIEYLASLTGVSKETMTSVFSLLGLIGTIVITPVGLIYTFWQYKVKRFLDHITYSGNIFTPDEDGVMKLRIRNVAHLPIDDVLPRNWVFRFKFVNAIRRCDTFIRMSSADMDILQPAIVSALSNVHGADVLALLLGRQVDTEKLHFAVTHEKDGSVKNQKVRVVLVSDFELSRFDNPTFAESVRFERTHHAYRVVTLGKMRLAQVQEKDLPPGKVRVVRPFFAMFSL